MADEIERTKESALDETLKGVPITSLIAAPLQAAAEAQAALARTTVDFLERVGFEKNEETGESTTRLMKFSVQRPAETPDGIVVSSLDVQVPVLALVPAPYLAVETVSVDFQMEVTATELTESKGSSQAPSQVEVSGRISSSASTTRNSNQSAKYQISVTAKKQEPTEGFSRLMDILSTCVAPTVKPKGE